MTNRDPVRSLAPHGHTRHATVYRHTRYAYASHAPAHARAPAARRGAPRSQLRTSIDPQNSRRPYTLALPASHLLHIIAVPALPVRTPRLLSTVECGTEQVRTGLRSSSQMCATACRPISNARPSALTTSPASLSLAPSHIVSIQISAVGAHPSAYPPRGLPSRLPSYPECSTCCPSHGSPDSKTPHRPGEPA
jgi:hypothetical protein